MFPVPCIAPARPWWRAVLASGFSLLTAIAILPVGAANDYPLTPDSLPQPGVPQGSVIDGTHLSSGTIFPGTSRSYSVYIPKQYDGSQPACLMVFQDGKGRANEWKVTTVFDNLIHRGEMPVTLGVFVSPGVVPAAHTNAQPRFNRSFEYDSMGDRYVRFLQEEFLPFVAQQHQLRITSNPSGRAIAGASSGGIAAFTAAWERPDAFSRVFCTIGTFVGLRGGNDYPTLVRKTEPKPIRVFLQDGSNDLNIYGGNWWVANQDMLNALEFSGYEVRHAWGDGGHDGKQGAAVFPDAMRWLWKDHPQPPASHLSDAHPLAKILLRDEGWKLVSEGHQFTEGPAVNAQGEVFFTDLPNHRIHRVALDGRVSVFAENSRNVNGLMFDDEGYLYACQHGSRRIVRYTPDGREEVVLEDAPSNDLVVRQEDGYYTDPENHRVWHVNAGGRRTLADEGIAFPNGVVTSPDQTQLYVSDSRGWFVYSFQIQPDGSLSHRQPFFHLHVPDAATESGADGMTVDTEGRLYVTTALGLQICDQPGRVNAILPKPHRAWLSNVVFGGPQLDELYVTCGDKVFKRRTQAKGVLSWKAPIKPPTPRL
ncbi:MAG: SMP-30/gluconolactonase/LRE family protein [Verrucomicrobiales bacterium]|nr:SMP-30/gluconolactonase/LRE family protein [Verrucomicrobiales bacterium]